jgi:hypothetical protein
MKKKTILLVLLLLLASFLLFLPCDKDLYCRGSLFGIVQYPFIWFFILTPISLVAFTLNDQKYKFWLKFTSMFFVVSMFFVYIMPEYDPAIVSIDRKLTNWFFVGLYSLISIIYFIVQFIKNKKQSQNKIS